MTYALHIRPAREDDLEALLDIWERSVRATHFFLSEADVEFYRPLVEEALAGGAMDLWVLASPSDIAMGFLGLAGDKIEALFMPPEHRGRGGGRKLVAHAQALVGGELRVDVNEQNQVAVGFWKALGFVVEGRSELDGAGRPFPLLHLRRPAPGSHA